jgi:hypothetical protein
MTATLDVKIERRAPCRVVRCSATRTYTFSYGFLGGEKYSCTAHTPRLSGTRSCLWPLPSQLCARRSRPVVCANRRAELGFGSRRLSLHQALMSSHLPGREHVLSAGAGSTLFSLRAIMGRRRSGRAPRCPDHAGGSMQGSAPPFASTHVLSVH